MKIILKYFENKTCTKYSDQLKDLINYWETGTDFQTLKNRIDILTQHHSYIHSYKAELKPHIQNKLKTYIHNIKKCSPEIHENTIIELEKQLHMILMKCNEFSNIRGINNEVIKLSKEIQDFWYKFITTLRNLNNCSIYS